MFDGFKEFWAGKKKKDDSPKVALDVDSGGKKLYKEDIIAEILEELERRREERMPLEKQWSLNANFLMGNQFCDINVNSGQIEQTDAVFDWLEREAFNRIAPLVETRIANLKRIKYAMTVKPRTNELDDYQKADVSTSILRHVQSETNFDGENNTLIAFNELCGNAFWISWWDKNAGELIATEEIKAIGPDGVEEAKSVAYYEGGLAYGILTPYEVFPESIFKQGVGAQRSIIVEQVKSVADVRELYDLDIDGQEVDSFCLTPVTTGAGFGGDNTIMSLGTKTIRNAAKVVTYFERPSKHVPRGKMVIIVNEEHLVYYGDLPYDKIPIVQVVCKEVAGQFFGKAVIEELIPLQRAYNGCLNRIHEYIKRISIQSWVAEEGSIDVEEYEENGLAPGAIQTYKRGFNAPTPIRNSDLPQEVQAERHNLVRDMEYVAAVSQLMAIGSAPSGVTSGKAIDSLREIDNTRLSLTGDFIRNGTKELAKCWLGIFKRYAKTSRIISYVGTNNIGSSIVWTSEDINSFDVEFDTENELAFSEEMQRERFLQAYQMGLFADGEGKIPERVKHLALEHMKVGNYSETMNINTLQIQAAQREQVFFENGVLPEASEIDDHQIHEEEHTRFVLQMKFQILKSKKPELAQAFMEHLKQHKEIAMQELMESQMKMQTMQQGILPQQGGM